MMASTTLPASTNGQERTRSRVSAWIAATARVLMGMLFTVTGLNGFLNFLPSDPGAMPPEAVGFTVALADTGYMLQLTAGVQLVAGVLLVANRYVPLALTLLAPVVVNILAFHLFLAPSGTVVAVAVSALQVYLAWAHRDAFRPMLRASH